MTYYCIRCKHEESDCVCDGKLFFSLHYHSFLEQLSNDQVEQIEADIEDVLGRDVDEGDKIVLDLDHATDAGILILNTDLVLGEGTIGPALVEAYKSFRK